MTLNAKWEAFRRDCIAPDAPAEGVEMLRHTFFAGASAYHRASEEILDSTRWEQWEEQNEALEAELQKTCADIINSLSKGAET